jgi:hypothetical protein
MCPSKQHSAVEHEIHKILNSAVLCIGHAGNYGHGLAETAARMTEKQC